MRRLGFSRRRRPATCFFGPRVSARRPPPEWMGRGEAWILGAAHLPSRADPRAVPRTRDDPAPDRKAAGPIRADLARARCLPARRYVCSFGARPRGAARQLWTRRTFGTARQRELAERASTQGQVRPNQRCTRLEPNSALSATSAGDGPSSQPVGACPVTNVTPTFATWLRPNSR